MTDTTEARRELELRSWLKRIGRRPTPDQRTRLKLARQVIDLAGKLEAAQAELRAARATAGLGEGDPVDEWIPCAVADSARYKTERDTLRTKLDEANGQIAKLICDHASEMEAAKSTIEQQKRIIETARVMEDAAAVIGRELEGTRQEREALRAQVAEQARAIGRLTNENAELRRPFRTDVANLRAELACRVAEVAGVAKERDAARREVTAAQNRLNVAESSLRMRNQEIEQLRADKERLITQADSLTNNLVRARELIEAESARLAECEPVVEAVRAIQEAWLNGTEDEAEELETELCGMTLPPKRTP
jgi:chromosome segregation ATPase